MSLQRRLPRLSQFRRVELPTPRQAALLQRKTWAVRASKVGLLLSRFESSFSLVCTDGGVVQRATVLYLDTADERCQFHAIRGTTPRFQVRHHGDLQTESCRLEVSVYTANEREQTESVRITRLGFQDARANNWLRQRLPFDPMLLQPSVRSTFTRLTLCDRHGARLEIDLDLLFTLGASKNRSGALARVSLVGPPPLNTQLVDAAITDLEEQAEHTSPWPFALPMVCLRERDQAVARPDPAPIRVTA